LEVGVETFDDVLLFILEGSEQFLFGEGEESVVEFFPEQDASSRKFMDRFTEFRTDGDNTTSGALIRLFPIFVVETGGIDNGLLSLYKSESERERIAVQQ